MTDILKTKIAILGTTGYIGRALLYEIQQDSDVEVVGYSRDVEAARRTLNTYKIASGDIKNYEELVDHKYDVVINATGIGSPKEVMRDPGQVFDVTEEVDKILFSYLEKYPDVRVFSISSGSIYGKQSNQAINAESRAIFDPGSLSSGDYYSLAKLCSEAKHRSWTGHSVVDLRVFAFIGRWLDPQESFFISEVSKCLLEDKTFTTLPSDMVRDYSTASDIWNVITFLCSLSPTNSAFDMQSQSPVAKFELLNRLRDKFGLRYLVDKAMLDQSPTGSKNYYCSQSDALSKLGFNPTRTALESIEIEIAALLSERK